MRWMFVLAALTLPACASASDKVILWGPYASDSVQGHGGSVFTTGPIQCSGATAVHFYIRDSVTSAVYVDSFTTANIQFSNDGTNWVNGVSPVANGSTQVDTAGAAVTGDMTNVSFAPANCGGWKVVSVYPLYDTDAAMYYKAIPAKWCRLYAIPLTRPRDPNIQGDLVAPVQADSAAAMLKPRVRVAVVYGKGAQFSLPTP